MLPFAKQKSPSEDEILELADEDLVVLADSGAQAPEQLARTVPKRALAKASLPPVSSRSSQSVPAAVPSAAQSRRFLRPDERVEEDVAGECLASIAAETRSRGGLLVRTPRELDVDLDVEVDVELLHTPARAPLPPLSAPPPRPSVPWARESAPGGPFARTSPSSSRGVPVAAPSFPPSLPSVPSYDSVAPVSAASGARVHEPTVIVLREKPKRAWYVGSAVVGAACALVAMRLVATSSAAPRPPATNVSASVSPNVTVAQATPLAVTPAASPAPSAAPVTVIRFDETQGVAITVPTAAPPPVVPAVHAPPHPPAEPPTKSAPPVATAAALAVAPKPPVSKPTPTASTKLPDGSFSLGGSDTVAPTPAPRPAPAPAPAPARKGPLTPEQELAEAQLKASMR